MATPFPTALNFPIVEPAHSSTRYRSAKVRAADHPRVAWDNDLSIWVVIDADTQVLRFVCVRSGFQQRSSHGGSPPIGETVRHKHRRLDAPKKRKDRRAFALPVLSLHIVCDCSGSVSDARNVHAASIRRGSPTLLRIVVSRAVRTMLCRARPRVWEALDAR